MDKTERRKWEKLLIVSYHNAEKRFLAFPKKDRSAVLKLIIDELKILEKKPDFLKYTIWDASVNFQNGITYEEEKKLLDAYRKNIEKFDEIVDALMFLSRYIFIFQAHKNGMDLLEAASFVGKHITEKFSEEEMDRDAERLMRNRRIVN